MAKRKARPSNRLAFLVGGGVVAAVLLYLLAAPVILAGWFTGAVKGPQQALSSKMDAVYATFEAPVYKQDRTDALPDDAPTSESLKAYDQDKAELAAARQTIDAAQQELDQSSKKLDGFVKLPLLGWNDDYRKATAAGQELKAYLSKSKAYLNDYRQLTDFADKSTDVSKQVVAAGAVLDNPPDDLGAIAATIEQLAAKVDEGVAGLKALSPPEYLRSEFEKDLKNGEQVARDFREMAGAVRALNLAKLQEITARLEAQSKVGEAEAATFFQRLQTDSPYRKSINELKQAQQSIANNLR